MRGSAPAKFMLCRKIPLGIELDEADWKELWIQHRELSHLLNELAVNVENSSQDGWEMKDASPNLLDLKSVLVNKMLPRCNFCEWKCNVASLLNHAAFCSEQGKI